MNPIAIRLLNQQLVAPQYSDPAEDYWMMIGLCAPKAIAVTKL